jgi:hypothetical protein
VNAYLRKIHDAGLIGKKKADAFIVVSIGTIAALSIPSEVRAD